MKTIFWVVYCELQNKSNTWKHSIGNNKPYDYGHGKLQHGNSVRISSVKKSISQLLSTLLLLCSSTPYFMFKEATQQWTAKRAISCWKKYMGTYTQYTYHMWITALLWVSSSMLSLSSPSWVAVCLPSQPGWVAVSSPSPAGWPAVCSPLVQQGD